jgi:signal transduction histidine kinase
MNAWQTALAGLCAAPGVVLGLVLVVRRQRVVGALLVLLGAMPLLLLSPESSAPGSTPHGTALLLEVMRVAGWVWFYVPPALLAACFPDGRVGRGWWWLPVGWAVFLVLFHIAVAVDPESYGSGAGKIAGEPPLEVSPWLNQALGLGSLVLLLALLIGSAARIVVRYRRGDDVLRRQVKWVAMSVVLLPIVLVLTWIAYLFTDIADVVVVTGLLLVFVSVPVSVAIAVLRHDLYDIDRLFSRTIGYLVLSGLLVAVFAVTTVAVGVVVGRGSDPAIAIGTLGAAVAFGLLRRRLQSRVDSRFDRDRRDALREVSGFVVAVRDGSAEPEALERTLRRALRDPALTVAYSLASDPEAPWRDGHGRPTARPDGQFLDVAIGGRLVGSVAYTEAARRPALLREVLREAHLPFELAHSRIELRHALAEAEASRARLVEASDAERRRLERDLHDGAQQQLIGIGMSLRLAQRRADPDDPLQPVLTGAISDLQGAVAELRRLAQGVRPSGLDEGLTTALRGLTRASPVPVDIRVTRDPIPEALATTAYYVAAEGVTNALKHADPTGISVVVERGEHALRVVVQDDGRGGAVAHPGSGLAGLRDRVQAVGGRLLLESLPSGGTRVAAVLPCDGGELTCES